MLAKEKFLPKYKSGEDAVIINTSSIAGVSVFSWPPSYTASKHAIVALSKALGAEDHYKISKVRVMAICPGRTETALANLADITPSLYPNLEDVSLQRAAKFPMQE